MNTKIKLLVILMCSLGLVTNVEAAGWYGNHQYHTSWNAGWCNQDSQPDATGPNPNPEVWGPYPGDNPYPYSYYSIQGRVIQDLGSGWMVCQFWDGTKPTNASISITNNTSSTNGWGKDPIGLYMSASDYGGANIVSYRIYVSTSSNAPGFSSWWTVPAVWTTIAGGNNVSTTYPISSMTSGTAYRFYVVAIDGAGNESPAPTILSIPSAVYKFDNTPPIISGISSKTNGNIIANTNQSFVISGGPDCGSPYMVTATFGGTPVTATPSATCPYTYTFNRDIHDVDSSRGANGGRQWDYIITQVCDLAGNCVNGAPLPKTFSYIAYADVLNAINTPATSNTNLTNGTLIADGSPQIFNMTLKDQFGNAIVPATGINRTISMNLSGISNSMYLNQYDRSGGSSVFVDTNTTTLLQSAGPQSLGARNSSDGSYPLSLFVYTPTKGTGSPESDSSATFGFTSNLVVNDSLIGMSANKTFSQSLSVPSFSPLYTSQISGDLRDGGFIEGVTQTSNITITQNGTTSPTNPSLQIGFSGSSDSLFQFFGGNDFRTRTLSPFVEALFVGNTTFISNMTQIVETLPAGSLGLQFSTHFSYTLDNKKIIYNGDIIGKLGGYWGTTTVGSATQVGIKVIGPIASNVISAIMSGQFANGTSIFGGISRSEVRNKMKQSIALATRNMTLRPTPDHLSDLSTLSTTSGNAQGAIIDKGDGSSIIRLEKTGGNITLEDIQVSGLRTLVIRGADLYIHGNMSYADMSSILGVVLQKDEAGNGGNLYIDPSVTNIVGTYIIDGSVSSSSDGLSIIGVGDISTLKNQLYIYGSIVSENTIGGSRMSPVKCPTQVSSSCGSTTEAQKYDLNYLRRYYLFGGKPFGNGKVIGGGTCIANPVPSCVGFISGLKTKFTSPTEDFAQYPIIIEYNPLIRTTPPIGFEQTRE